MLVFSRKKSEQAVITVPPSTEPRQIVVTMIELRGDKARLGFVADKDIVVHRREVQDEVDGAIKGIAESAERLGLHNDHAPR